MEKFLNKRKLLVIGVFFVLCVTAVGVSFIKKYYRPAGVNLTGNTQVVVFLKEKGFEPYHIKIRRGTQVDFKTTEMRDFWPASNNHPWHHVYPAFDAKNPIKPNETWSFVFNEVGTWDYHDHLLSFFAGRIEVVD